MYFSDAEPAPLRSYVRYYRRIKRIQRELTKTMTKIMNVHFETKYGIELNPHSLDIKLTTTSDIEKLEAAESVNLAIDNVKELVELTEVLNDQKISDEGDPLIQKDKMRDLITKMLTDSGLPLDLFEKPDEKTQETEKVES
jgi:two-component SAPR family response regulator